MKRDIHGEDFRNLIEECGEQIRFLPKAVTDTVPEGVEDGSLVQYASIVPNRANKAVATTEGAYLFTGNITFDNIEQQERFIGRYFIRETQPNVTNMLTSVFPENSSDRLGTVQTIECNEKVDIISCFEDTGEQNEFGDPVQRPVYLHQDVLCFVTAMVKSPGIEEVGALDKTMTYLTLPAEYTVSTTNIIMKPSFAFNEKTLRNEYIKTPYKIDSIDTSMMDFINGEIVGTVKCLISEAQDNEFPKI